MDRRFVVRYQRTKVTFYIKKWAKLCATFIPKFSATFRFFWAQLSGGLLSLQLYFLSNGKSF